MPLAVFCTSHQPLGRPVCAGCGQSPWNFSPVDAVGTVHVFAQRCEDLMGLPGVVLDHHTPTGGWRTALELITGAVGLLGATASALTSRGRPGPAAAVSPGTAVVAADLRDNTAGLVAAIEAVPGVSWDPVPFPAGDMTPAGMVWLALHDITHGLEDAQLAVRAALAGHPSLLADLPGSRYRDQWSAK